ncbi:MAG: HAD family hydrolase [Chloroflexota bacterium]|nr:MAG: HAD family hydrolase [Chloroflexota bacterium]
MPQAHPSGRHPRGLLVLDFDGTLWRGNEPLQAYAAAVAQALPSPDQPIYLSRVNAFLAGERWSTPAGADLPEDGWAAVARFAADYGATAADCQGPFAETRARIAAGAFHLEVPAGLPEFLVWAKAWCTVVLASNSPAGSVLPVLDRLGLTARFDDVACEAHKPTGLTTLGPAWTKRFGVEPARVMSIGDHYPNDIAPAHAAGWSTTYVTPWRAVAGPCSVVGTTVEEVLPSLRAWVTVVVAGGRTGGEKEHDRLS